MKNTLSTKYLALLAEKFPNSVAVGREIVRLESTLNLPKGAEIYLSDIHGEYEPFRHVIKNGSGIIIKRLRELFGQELDQLELRRLAAIIYYPEEKLELLRKMPEIDEFYQTTLTRLITVARDFASFYSKYKVRAIMPEDYKDMIEELIHERENWANKKAYYRQIIQTISEIGQADRLIAAFAKFIQRLAVLKIHIIGDVYDRGPGAEIIMDTLMDFQSVDVQWGNHDIVWMGAAAGSTACIANVLRLSLRYGNTNTLEKGYGINLMPLASFALERYKDDESIVFNPKVGRDELLSESEQWLNRIMHKAISIIQFKLEGQLIQRRPDWGLQDRLLLDKVDYATGTLTIGSETYPLQDTFLPTIDPEDPYRLSEEEAAVMAKLEHFFADSQRLQAHAQFLFEKGGMYCINNGNLLYHGCIPLTEAGGLASWTVQGVAYKGRALMDVLETLARKGYFARKDSAERAFGRDLLWYLWSGPMSPIFGKAKMATFERYFLKEKATHKEPKNPYYQYRDQEDTCSMILEEFGLNPLHSTIMNGHVPVVVRAGESPVKANGKLVVIDGGFAKAYQEHTGIAGYTLIHNSYGLELVAHHSFESTQKAIEEELDIASTQTILHQSPTRLRVRDLDDGRVIMERVQDLRDLLAAMEDGTIPERYFE